jgi:hypothetical protein
VLVVWQLAPPSSIPFWPRGQIETSAPASGFVGVALGSVTVPRFVPCPLSGIVWGLPEALSLKTSCALRLPAAEGVNVTVTVQDTLGATVCPLQPSSLSV